MAPRQRGIRLKPAKTKLIKTQVDYLGHTLSKDSIAMQEEYIAQILDWPARTTPKDLMALFGFLGYYHSFISEYSDLTWEMNCLKTTTTMETHKMDAQLAKL